MGLTSQLTAAWMDGTGELSPTHKILQMESRRKYCAIPPTAFCLMNN